MFMHDKIRLGIAALGLAGIAGCFTGPLEGTWLLKWDRGSYASASSCEDDDTGSQTTLSGDEFEWADVYYTDGGGIVVSTEGQEYVGTADGKSFSVEAQYGESVQFSSSSYSYNEWVVEIDADLVGTQLEGSSDYKQVNGNQSGECRYQAKQDFTAVKVKAMDRPTRTVGSSGGDGE